jgi:Sulfotransferase domain
VEPRVVGAGVGRTGTMSLKFALEKLLGAPCYHMIEVFGHADHVELWTKAARGEPVDWDAMFEDYAAIVDWPACSFWPEISTAFPDAVILLSTRSDSEAWFKSANDTIFSAIDEQLPADMGPWRDMFFDVARTRFTDQVNDHDAAIAAYEAHNEKVRRDADPNRLVEWQPGDGWKPLCDALGLPVPDEPFPHANTTEEFVAGRGG